MFLDSIWNHYDYKVNKRKDKGNKGNTTAYIFLDSIWNRYDLGEQGKIVGEANSSGWDTNPYSAIAD